MAGLSRSRWVGIVIAAVVVAAIVVAGAVYLVGSKNSNSSASTASAAADVVDPPVALPPPKIAPLAASDKVPTTAGIDAALAGQLANPALAQFSGIVIDPATGSVIWNKDSNAAQLPASTAKLLTGTALLTSVDPTSRFVTKVVQGDQDGDIVLVGGGDVTLSARNTGVDTVYAGAPMMADLAAQVKASGIDVKRIVLDTDYWSGDDLADGWQTGDIRGTQASAQGYITRMAPLMVDGDREDPANENSIRTGDPANTAGKALARLLGTPDLPLIAGTAPPEATVVGQVSSQPMSVLLAQALENSDNVLAEALARQVAIARGAPPSFTGASAAIIEALEDLQIDTIGVEMYRRFRHLHQGSGAAGGARPGRRTGGQGGHSGAAQSADRAAGRRGLRQFVRSVPGRRVQGRRRLGAGQDRFPRSHLRAGRLCAGHRRSNSGLRLRVQRRQ